MRIVVASLLLRASLALVVLVHALAAVGFMAAWTYEAYQRGKAEAELEALREVVEQKDSARIVALDSVEVARSAAERATQRLTLATARWEHERDSLAVIGRRAHQEAAGLRRRIRAIATPEVQILVDSLTAAHDAEVRALEARIASMAEENDALWTERRALQRLIARQDTALHVSAEQITALTELSDRQDDILHPPWWDGLRSEVGRAVVWISVGALVGVLLR